MHLRPRALRAAFTVCVGLSGLAVLAPGSASAAGPAKPALAAPPAPTPVTDLSPPVRELLRKEMVALQGAVGGLAGALAVGEWQAVQDTAAQAAAGFVIPQALTRPQRDELLKVLPDGYHRLDDAFHAEILGLARAARDRNSPQAAFYFGRMTETCMTCHARFAGERFPGFSLAPVNDHDADDPPAGP
jgi:hypothetical protein